MNKNLFPMLLGGFLACLSGAAALAADSPVDPGKPGTELRGESTIHAYRSKDGCGTTVTTDLRFTPVRIYDGARGMNAILRETIEQHDQDCHEGVDGKVSVEATAYDDDYKAGKPLWTLSTRGWSAQIYEDAGHFYRVSMPGCCGSSDTDSYFSLRNGKHLFDATTPLMKIQLTAGDYIKGEVFAAVFDSATSLPDRFQLAANAPDAIAVLYLGTDTQPAENIVIHGAPRESDACHADALSLVVDGKLLGEQNNVEQARFTSSAAPAGGKGVLIRGKLDCASDDSGELTFDVPIVAGHLSVTGARSSDPKVRFSAGKSLKN